MNFAVSVIPSTRDCLEKLGVAGALTHVTPLGLAVASVACLALIASCMAILLRSAMHQPVRVEGSAMRSGLAYRDALWMVALCLTVFSAKLLLMRSTPVLAPYWDQWGAEGSRLIVPFADCHLPWSQMVGFHNEHRIFFTRLLTLDLLWLDGQWDPRLEQVTNAALHALTATVLALIFWIANDRRRIDVVVISCGVICVLPFGWENTLVGFQSQFYFFVLFSMLALWLTIRYRVGQVEWWVGWACAIAAIFTSAGGVLTAATIGGAAFLTLLSDVRSWRDCAWTFAVALVIFAGGMLLASAPIAAHIPLQAATLGVFFRALTSELAWPWVESARFAPLAWLPFGLLVISCAGRGGRTTLFERLTLTIGAWVIANALALAYARGGGAQVPASRYQDFLSIGWVVNVMALLAAISTPTRRPLRWLSGLALTAWLVFSCVGLNQLETESERTVAQWRQIFAVQAANVREFVTTGRRAEFVAKKPLAELPLDDPEGLANLLGHPVIRQILPAGLREPIHLRPSPRTGTSVASNGSRVPGGALFDEVTSTWSFGSATDRLVEGNFESQSITCTTPGHLEFNVSGYLGLDHQYLALKDSVTGKEESVRPAALPIQHWAPVMVPCPRDSFSIVAVDAAQDLWFGFREPVEIGELSFIAEWLITRSRGLLLIGVAIALMAARWPDA